MRSHAERGNEGMRPAVRSHAQCVGTRESGDLLLFGQERLDFGVTAAGVPFVVCTTCHNQHVMTIYTSSASSPIAADGGGFFYNTYFFINAPYNVNHQTYSSTLAPSTTQFCRQCHFGESNEANNTFTIKTAF